jgi:hypothetical protein
LISWYLIPLIGTPQTFQINLAGTNYQLTVKWNNTSDAGWEFDISNADTNTLLLAGAPFVSGTNLLANLGYLGIGGTLVCITGGNSDAVPTFTNLGTDANLYFGSPS